MAVNTISLILAIAFLLPPLFTSSLARNETSAVSSLLSIYKAEQSFRSTNSLRAYGVLRELSSAGLIETALGSGIKGGYQFEVRLEADSFEAVATPVIYGSRWDFKRTGIRSFYINLASYEMPIEVALKPPHPTHQSIRDSEPPGDNTFRHPETRRDRLSGPDTAILRYYNSLG